MKEKKYLVLYYISFVITLIFTIYSSLKSLNLYSISEENNTFKELSSSIFGSALFVINLILVIVFTILIWKKKIKVDNIILPIIYIVFFTIVVILTLLFNNKVLISYMHFDYYLFFINTGYVLLNIYSLCLINCKNKG